MSCLPFRRVEFPRGTLACAYGALLLLHGAAQLSCKTVWCHERRELDAFALGEGAAKMRKS